jgi:serine/threonine protein kinase
VLPVRLFPCHFSLLPTHPFPCPDPLLFLPGFSSSTLASSSGRVKIAKHTQTGQYAAVKILPKHTFMSSRMSISQADAKADKYASGIEREIVIMKLIDHPNIMSLYDVWEHKDVLFVSPFTFHLTVRRWDPKEFRKLLADGCCCCSVWLLPLQVPHS